MHASFQSPVGVKRQGAPTQVSRLANTACGALPCLELHIYFTQINCAHNKQPLDCKLSQLHICCFESPVSSEVILTHCLRATLIYHFG